MGNWQLAKGKKNPILQEFFKCEGCGEMAFPVGEGRDGAFKSLTFLFSACTWPGLDPFQSLYRRVAVPFLSHPFLDSTYRSYTGQKHLSYRSLNCVPVIHCIIILFF